MKSSGLLLLVGLLTLWAELTPVSGRPDICYLPVVVGKCLAYFPRYFFNSNSKKCEKFIYGGCGRNGNNFPTLEKCRYTCEEKKGRCPTPRPGTITTCDVTCGSDWECPGNKKCCRYQCNIGCHTPV